MMAGRGRKRLVREVYFTAFPLFLSVVVRMATGQ
jgi:hypothetical protein